MSLTSYRTAPSRATKWHPLEGNAKIKKAAGPLPDRPLLKK
ncbi:MAG: hypothetical protein ABJQ41_00740 [Marinomonas sp.]